MMYESRPSIPIQNKSISAPVRAKLAYLFTQFHYNSTCKPYTFWLQAEENSKKKWESEWRRRIWPLMQNLEEIVSHRISNFIFPLSYLKSLFCIFTRKTSETSFAKLIQSYIMLLWHVASSTLSLSRFFIHVNLHIMYYVGF